MHLNSNSHANATLKTLLLRERHKLFPHLATDLSPREPQGRPQDEASGLAASTIDILSTTPGSYQALSGTSMATPMALGGVARFVATAPEFKAERDKQTASDVRGLAKEQNLSLNQAVDTYLFCDADNFELGLSKAEIKAQRDEKRQELFGILALEQPETQRTVANGPIAILD